MSFRIVSESYRSSLNYLLFVSCSLLYNLIYLVIFVPRETVDPWWSTLQLQQVHQAELGQTLDWLRREPNRFFSTLLFEKLDSYSSYQEWISAGKKIPDLEKKLLLLLRKNSDRKLKLSIIAALHGVGSMNSIPFVFQLCKSSDSKIRYAAIELIGHICPFKEFVFIELLRSINDVDPGVRSISYLELYRIGGKEFAIVFRHGLNDRDMFVRSVVSKILSSIEE